MSNEEKAIMIADQCKPCSDDFYKGIKQGVKLALVAESKSFEKADKWDELDNKIGQLYTEDENNGDEENCDLVTIGELAASAFGYL